MRRNTTGFRVFSGGRSICTITCIVDHRANLPSAATWLGSCYKTRRYTASRLVVSSRLEGLANERVDAFRNGMGKSVICGIDMAKWLSCTTSKHNGLNILKHQDIAD